MRKKINYLSLLVFFTLCACSDDVKFETSTGIKKYYHWGHKYRDFYLVSNYDDSKYSKIEELVSYEFNKILKANDSIELVHFSFYKRNWNTSRFLNDDPFGHHSPLLPENDNKYGEYFIDWIYYERFKKPNIWIYHSMKTAITDTIEMKIMDKKFMH
ncbi:hypothetical protein [Plebeiibacterium marinum]|uniref:Lipoprotein n=1 Tax=Plebeiibacterium marinum TaxID=2992111 RepID=A0AAE3SJA7_9BACT|nr:hypothetical protein [Plebeiobacterium marinum]MCW3805208.1 hypothetical protein [Plebeiobacterium marinum]